MLLLLPVGLKLSVFASPVLLTQHLESLIMSYLQLIAALGFWKDIWKDWLQDRR